MENLRLLCFIALGERLFPEYARYWDDALDEDL